MGVVMIAKWGGQDTSMRVVKIAKGVVNRAGRE